MATLPVRRAIAAVPALILILLVGACAPNGVDTDVDPEAEAAIQVNNDLIPSTVVTVWIIPDVGSRQMLGTVSPGDSETLRFDAGATTREYRLRARTTAGAEIVSTPFSLAAGQAVEWNLNSNMVTPL